MLRAVDGSAPVADGSAVLADVPSAGFAKGELGEGVNVSAVDAFDVVVHFFSFVGGFFNPSFCVNDSSIHLWENDTLTFTAERHEWAKRWKVLLAKTVNLPAFLFFQSLWSSVDP